MSDRTMWEARVGRFTLHQNGDPSSGDWTTPSHRDLITGVSLENGTVLPVFVLTNSTFDRRFFLTNPASQFVHYDGLVVAIEKRLSMIGVRLNLGQ